MDTVPEEGSEQPQLLSALPQGREGAQGQVMHPSFSPREPVPSGLNVLSQHTPAHHTLSQHTLGKCGLQGSGV